MNIGAVSIPNNIVALLIFLLVLALVILRRVRGLEFPIWSTMMIWAALMILTGVISVSDAYRSIDFEVVFFLIGMFGIVAGVEKSGLLGYIMYRALSPFKNPRSLLNAFVFLMGFLSALTVNDTMAIVGTLIVITIVKQMLLPLDDLLIALAFSITVGSVMTPIGNPQNMLIASQSGIGAPFLSFVGTLSVPTLINLAVVAGFLWFTLKRDEKDSDKKMVVIEEEHITNMTLAKVSGCCLVRWRLHPQRRLRAARVGTHGAPWHRGLPCLSSIVRLHRGEEGPSSRWIGVA